MGVSHIGVYAADPAATERFYVHDLGATRGADPENEHNVRYYFSALQFVEVLPLPQGPASINRLDHIAFATPDAAAMRQRVCGMRSAEIMELHAIGKPCCSPFTAADPVR